MLNLFFPIYQKLEQELINISFQISFTKTQQNVYSSHISDLILRTSSECENIAQQICRKYKLNIDGDNKPKQIYYLHDYIDGSHQIFQLSEKIVNFKFENAESDFIDSPISPFQKKVQNDGREKYDWYFVYNKIKHDRVTYSHLANLKHFIEALAALYLLNLYYTAKSVNLVST